MPEITASAADPGSLRNFLAATKISYVTLPDVPTLSSPAPDQYFSLADRVRTVIDNGSITALARRGCARLG